MPNVTAAERIAANVRAELARQQRSGSSLSKSLDWSQAAMARRLSGRIPFNVDELDRIAAELNVSLSYLILGVEGVPA